MNRTQFIEASNKLNGKLDTKQFLKSVDAKFADVTEYRKNFTLISGGSLYAYSISSKCFYKLEVAA